MNLSEFLLARIAEDEEVARGAIRWSEGADQWADAGEPDWQHIARWDPARVLAECAAKRRIVEEHEREWRGAKETDSVQQRYGSKGRLNGLWTALQLIALPYADHPDYREEWAL